MSFCSLIKGTAPKILMLCFILINNVLWNLLYVWISRVHSTQPYVTLTCFTHGVSGIPSRTTRAVAGHCVTVRDRAPGGLALTPSTALLIAMVSIGSGHASCTLKQHSTQTRMKSESAQIPMNNSHQSSA